MLKSLKLLYKSLSESAFLLLLFPFHILHFSFFSLSTTPNMSSSYWGVSTCTVNGYWLRDMELD